MVAWPDTLPQLLQRDDFAEVLADGVVRSQTDTGPEKTRLRSTAAPSGIRGSQILTADQRDILKDYWRDDIKRGALVVQFPDPDVPEIPEDMTARPTIDVLFSSPPRITNIGGINFRVVYNFQVQP